jgi:hypothetical protein
MNEIHNQPVNKGNAVSFAGQNVLPWSITFVSSLPSIVDLIHSLTSLHILISDPFVSISLYSTKQR